jgi:hypothetical protein
MRMTTKQPDFADLNALAIEACDMWQEHLSTFANDPNARAELTRFLEPQRRLFADWAAMMQQGGKHEAGHEARSATTDSKNGSSAPSSAKTPGGSAAPAPSGGAAHGDDSLRVAQLALRVAELEKRLAQLETQTAAPPRRAQRASS